MSINIEDIKPFKFYAHKVLPLVYDDSLSYYEFLCKVLKKLNESIEQINELTNIIDPTTQSRLTNLEQEYTELLESINQINSKINEANANIATNTNDINTIKSQITSITTDINTIHAQIASLANSISVIQPFCAENRTRIQALETSVQTLNTLTNTLNTKVTSLENVANIHTSQINEILSGNPTLGGYIRITYNDDDTIEAEIFNDIEATGIQKVILIGNFSMGSPNICTANSTITAVTGMGTINRKIYLQIASYTTGDILSTINILIYAINTNGAWTVISVRDVSQ